MSRKKIIVAAIVLALVLLVGGLMAFFTDTKEESNVFTLGNVTITLTEPAWEENNAKNMSPGKTVAKNPTVNNVGSTPAFVFIEVKVPMTNDSTPQEIFTYEINDSDWTEIGSGTVSGGIKTHTYAYGSSTVMTELAAGTEQSPTSTSALFTEVTLNPNISDPTEIPLTNNKINLDIKAKAIQANDIGTKNPAEVLTKF